MNIAPASRSEKSAQRAPTNWLQPRMLLACVVSLLLHMGGVLYWAEFPVPGRMPPQSQILKVVLQPRSPLLQRQPSDFDPLLFLPGQTAQNQQYVRRPKPKQKPMTAPVSDFTVPSQLNIFQQLPFAAPGAMADPFDSFHALNFFLNQVVTPDYYYNASELEQRAQILGEFTPSFPAETPGFSKPGRLLLELLISEIGLLEKVNILESDHVALEASVLRAVNNMVFLPAEKNGKRVKSRKVMEFMYSVDPHVLYPPHVAPM